MIIRHLSGDLTNMFLQREGQRDEVTMVILPIVCTWDIIVVMEMTSIWSYGFYQSIQETKPGIHHIYFGMKRIRVEILFTEKRMFKASVNFDRGAGHLDVKIRTETH